MKERTCIITRECCPDAEMIRFVLDPNGLVVPDLKGNLPGRGAWVKAEHAFVEKAVKTKAFSRAFKKDVQMRADLADWTEALLREATLGSLAMARKAGALVSGSMKVQQAISSEQAILILHAQEAAEDGKRKIAQALYAQQKQKEAMGQEEEIGTKKALSTGVGFQPQGTIPIVTLFSEEELKKAFGDKFVIHFALLKNSASNSFIKRLKKLQFYRGETINKTASAVKESKRND